MSELQKAVSDAERKAHELITTERAKMERALAEAKRQASEDALTVINQQEDSSESCWNCGRKASETCSGCNTARYCGSFCQHKDWEKHHHVCGQTLQGLPAPSAPAAVGMLRAPIPDLSSPLLSSPLLSSRSDERQQPLAHRHQRGPVHPQWVQQRAGHLLQRLAVHPPAPTGLWSPAAQQTQAVPHHPAAVRQRHLA
uniref:CBFA2/RUNX1 partner transcriptional co-repressor 3 n=1 Tax=Meleagris gallopavo TaxID=9103 RepID=A0A803Y6I4_MELGA